MELSLAGEDQRSIDKNVAAIVSECRKAQPDKALLTDKLKRTARHRQKMCLEQTTAAVLESFPCLRQHHYVSAFLSRSHAIDFKPFVLTRCSIRSIGKLGYGNERPNLWFESAVKGTVLLSMMAKWLCEATSKSKIWYCLNCKCLE